MGPEEGARCAAANHRSYTRPAIDLHQLLPMRPGMTTPWMDAVASSVPKIEVENIHGVGHFAMIEGAQPINDAIAKFATRLD
jgi:pimeloyl-ACP methyl ester carboxylesterase